ETRMTQVSFSGPFCKLEVADENGLQPPAHAHLFFRQLLPPSSARCFRQIHERALRNFKSSELLSQPLPRRRREAVARSGHIHQLLALIVPKHQCIERIACGVATDYELLSLIDAHL